MVQARGVGFSWKLVIEGIHVYSRDTFEEELVVTFLIERLPFFYSLKSRIHEGAAFPVINMAHNIVRKRFTKVTLKVPS